MAVGVETSQILPFAGILLAIAWHITKRPVNQTDVELNVLSFLLQIFAGLAFLAYAANQSDVFVYAQHVPTLASAVTVTLRFHPYLRKRVRRSHEIIALVGVLGVTLAALCSSISPDENPIVGRYVLGAVAAAATLAWAAALLREAARIALSLPDLLVTVAPPPVEFASAVLALAHGLTWAAYGYFLATDAFISLPNLLLAVVGAAQLALYLYSLLRNGFGPGAGPDDGGYAQDYDDDAADDAIVGRINRARSVASSASKPRPSPGISSGLPDLPGPSATSVAAAAAADLAPGPAPPPRARRHGTYDLEFGRAAHPDADEPDSLTPVAPHPPPRPEQFSSDEAEMGEDDFLERNLSRAA
ncbi:hypothetical protein HK405_015801 [Cladochytrium tenue]|nr:hypothetical protein HK405_015801 [Cladochytrium tenue]